MKDILKELNSGNSVLIETEKLPDFWEYGMAQKDYHSFLYEYIGGMVKIRMIPRDIIIKIEK